MASALGWDVLIPTQPPPIRIISQVKRVFLFGSETGLRNTSAPSSRQLFMDPELVQWAVTSLPSSRTTSARKRLYRLISFPPVKG